MRKYMLFRPIRMHQDTSTRIFVLTRQVEKVLYFQACACIYSARRHGDKKDEEAVPSVATLIRILKKLSLADLQLAFAEFVNAILQDTSLIAAVDGKTAKQMKDADGNPILMLNVFAQKLKLYPIR